MTLRWLSGDCRETLRTLEAGSVQMCATSPPYWSLRDYGTPPLVWGGDAGHVHEWGTAVPPKRLSNLNEDFNHRWNPDWAPGGKQTAARPRELALGQFCPCGAWLGSLGLEPDPFMYIEHIVEVFQEVKRVLRDDGVLWLNMGSSYAGSGKGPTGHNGIGDQVRRQGFTGERSGKHDVNGWRGGSRVVDEHANGVGGVAGFKAKDMIAMPFFIAEALRQDGWYFRAMLPWVKRNCMPSSVTDRPGTSLEYVLYLSTSKRCYWDADAVRLPHAEPWRSNGKAERNNWSVNGARGSHETTREYNPAGRAFRDSDLFFQSWQGLLLDDDAEPMALVVNPAPLKLQHYASYPPKLVEPMVKASTSEKGQCPACGAPWVRIVDATKYEPVIVPVGHRDVDASRGDKTRKLSGADYNEQVRRTTLGWQQSCKCPPQEPVPQTILDPFGGSGTTGLVADRLSRNAILCELSSDYTGMGTNRVVGDAPLFVDLEIA